MLFTVAASIYLRKSVTTDLETHLKFNHSSRKEWGIRLIDLTKNLP